MCDTDEWYQGSAVTPAKALLFYFDNGGISFFWGWLQIIGWCYLERSIHQNGVPTAAECVCTSKAALKGFLFLKIMSTRCCVSVGIYKYQNLWKLQIVIKEKEEV